MSFGVPEMLIVLAVLLLLFGAKKVPDLARSLGQAKREFDRSALEESADASTAARATEAGGDEEASRAA
jgi:sec-independent protein translocase protein TatA